MQAYTIGEHAANAYPGFANIRGRSVPTTSPGAQVSSGLNLNAARLLRLILNSLTLVLVMDSPLRAEVRVRYPYSSTEG